MLTMCRPDNALRYVTSIVVVSSFLWMPFLRHGIQSFHMAERTSSDADGINSAIEVQPESLNQEQPEMKELFFHFLESPNRESYLAVRNALISSEHYDPYSSEMDSVNGFVDAGQFDEARETLSESMPNLLLCPSAHMAISFIAEKSGDEKAAQMERFVAATCCEGLLTTGDGTQENPYLVVRTSDEYALIEYLGKQFKSQSLIEDGNRHFDLIHCVDGSELWFDITDPYKRLGEIFGEGSL